MNFSSLNRAICLVSLIFLTVSCSNVRVDRVFSETFEILPCSGSPLCALDDRVQLLERRREVSGGVARNNAGTINPGCYRERGNFYCVTRQFVLPQTQDNLERGAGLFNQLADGYVSSRQTFAPSNCEIMTTQASLKKEYRAVSRYFDFSSVVNEQTKIFDRTGSALEDHTLVTFTCATDCAYDEKTEQWSNNIEVLLSKSRTSGRLQKAEKDQRLIALQKFRAICPSEAT